MPKHWTKLSEEQFRREIDELVEETIGTVRPAVEVRQVCGVAIVSPTYYEDHEPCGYCHRPIGSRHEKWCRQ